MTSPVAAVSEETAPSTNCPWADVHEDGANLTVDNFPTTLIVTLANSLRRTVTVPYAEQFDLKVSEWRLLSLLMHYVAVPFGELVALSGSDKALVSRALRMLQERGYVELRPMRGKGKPCYRVTRSGRALHAKVIPVARAHQVQVLSVLTQEERVVLYTALKKLHAVYGGAPAPAADAGADAVAFPG
jgi:DNA-binding MarR family transcriptional regulator